MDRVLNFIDKFFKTAEGKLNILGKGIKIIIIFLIIKVLIKVIYIVIDKAVDRKSVV